MKATAKTWYYIDFQRTIDVIKWRMYKIRKVIDDKLRNVGLEHFAHPRKQPSKLRCASRKSTRKATSALGATSDSARLTPAH